MLRKLRRQLYAFVLKITGFMSTNDGENNMDNNGSNRKNEYRILLIGKSGNGKSSSCNTIVGDQGWFPVGVGMMSATTTWKEKIVTRNGIKITVVDTPDVFNLNLTPRDMETEVTQWKSATRPFPSFIFLAVRCDVRYTAEEYAIYRGIRDMWDGRSWWSRQWSRLCGYNSLQNRLVVAFTFGDRQRLSLKEELKRVCPELKTVLTHARHRYIQINNEDPHKEAQVNDLMIKLKRWRHEDESQIPLLIKGLAVVSGVSGFFCAVAVAVRKICGVIVFGCIFVFSLFGIIFFKVTKKER